MEKPIYVLKPSISNAVVPTLLKNIVRSPIIAVILFGLLSLLQPFIAVKSGIIWLVVVLIAIVPIIARMIVLHNTNYYFYKTHIVSEFQLLKVKRHSVPYHQIVNITSDISIWDRFCKAGDLVLHTAEQQAPDLILYYVRNPKKVEHAIYQMVHGKKKEG